MSNYDPNIDGTVGDLENDKEYYHVEAGPVVCYDVTWGQKIATFKSFRDPDGFVVEERNLGTIRHLVTVRSNGATVYLPGKKIGVVA